MGALGCKYCDCDKSKMEDITQEMKINSNTPIIITPNKQINNKENEENISKFKEDFHSLNMNINSDIDIIQKDNTLNEISTNNIDSNTNNNINIMINEMINSNIINNDNIIEESINEFELNNNKENINNNENNNIFNNEDNNNIIDKNNSNKNLISISNKDMTIDINKNNSNNLSNNFISIEKKEEFMIDQNDNNQNLKESRASQLYISSPKEAKKKIKKYEIDKIQFGLEKRDKENLNKEQQRLYNEAEKNLEQFNPLQGSEITNVQKIMSNLILNLKYLINQNNSNFNLYDNNYILLNGILKKMINYEINAYKPTMYSDRFCVLYPKMLKYYKSKAQFLKNLKPACILPINQISAINIAKPKKSSKKIYHLIICNKFGIKKNYDNNIFLNLFDSQELNDFLISPDINESLLIFTSDDEKDVYKWYVIIQFLIEFSKIKEQ